MKSFVVVSLLSSVAFAQSSSSAAASSTASASALVPTGISSGCSSFLTSLNNNATFYSCTSSLIEATSSYGPGSDSTSASTSSINSALNSVCSTSGSCSDSVVKSKLADFYSSCGDELTNANADVVKIYDMLYTLVPMKNAVCSKDDSGRYCVTSLSSSSSSSAAASVSASAGVADGMSLETVQKYLWSESTTKGDENTVAYMPNATTFSSTNLPFLFLTSSLSSSQCDACTRNIMSSWVTFESTVPYAPGLSQSTILSGQADLYQAIQSVCGSSFMSGAVNAAGGISDSIVSGASRIASIEGGFVGVAATLLSVVAAGFTAL